MNDDLPVPLEVTTSKPPPAGLDERDLNGCLVERRWMNGSEVIIHYDEVPDSDRTVVDGISVTTVVRTIIDLAPELPCDDLDRIILTSIDRGLTTAVELVDRIDADDMAHRPGAAIVRRSLVRLRYLNPRPPGP